MNKNIFLSLLCLLFISILVLTKNYSPTSIHQSYINCLEENNNEVQQSKCIRELSFSASQNYSLKEMETELTKIAKSENFNWCHEFMHYIGWELVAKTTFAEAFSQAQDSCAYGMYHGIVEKYVGENSEQKVFEELNSNLCTNLAEPSQSHCHHGQGHAFMLISDNDLQQSFLSCEKLSTEAIVTCFSGALMEFSSPKQHVVQNKESSHKQLLINPNYPCNSLQEQNKFECYRYRGNINYILLNPDIDAVFNKCAEVDPSFRDICYQGIGHSIPNLQLSALDIELQCSKSLIISADAYTNCIKGVLPFLIQQVGSESKIIEDFCEAVRKTHTNFCYTEVQKQNS